MSRGRCLRCQTCVRPGSDPCLTGRCRGWSAARLTTPLSPRRTTTSTSTNTNTSITHVRLVTGDRVEAVCTGQVSAPCVSGLYGSGQRSLSHFVSTSYSVRTGRSRRVSAQKRITINQLRVVVVTQGRTCATEWRRLISAQL